MIVWDNNSQYLKILRRRFSHHDNIVIRQVDWSDANLDGLRTQRFDTILCLNVLEHLDDDEGTLAAFSSLLEPGGRLVLQVPAMQALFGQIGHRQRYERSELAAKLAAHGFAVTSSSYFNLPGVVAWWVNSVLLRRRVVPGVQTRLANLMVPWLRLEERWRPSWGMALLTVAHKAAAESRASAPHSLYRDCSVNRRRRWVNGLACRSG